MQITVNDEGQTAHVALVGRLDIKGAEVIEMPLATLSGAKQNILIDMSQVSFLASIGIRHLVSATKALARRGGRLILVGPQDVVREFSPRRGLPRCCRWWETRAKRAPCWRANSSGSPPSFCPMRRSIDAAADAQIEAAQNS